ncbi:fluoride efflux transporter FluC [Catenulispora rubra]|uniref:fluoride efflux transporter FluC n=1 Tax=Catenulispora rubra TaxID=280293 RepID=UPI002B26859D|nr:CrcB family protein [Catenulispora rubra]
MNRDADLTPADDLPTDPDLVESDPAESASQAQAQPQASRPRTPRRVLAAIAAGGALGGPARYGLGLAFPTAPHTFPATTFAINVTGSFVLALLMVFILDIWPPNAYVRPFFCVGFLGAYTTFSTWMVDTDHLLAAGAYGTAAANVFLSLAAGIAATSLGLSLGRGIGAWRGKRRRHLAQLEPAAAAALVVALSTEQS